MGGRTVKHLNEAIQPEQPNLAGGLRRAAFHGILNLRNITMTIGRKAAMALDIRGYGAHKTRTFMRELPKHRGGDIFAWVFFALSVVYLVIQFNPATMQWNMEF